MEFVYDLKLPTDFQPCVSDGEVEEFFCWPIEKVTRYRMLIIMKNIMWHLPAFIRCSGKREDCVRGV